MKIKQQKQINPVEAEVLALTAVVRPILVGVLYAIKQDVVVEAGGYGDVKLKMLPRLYRAGDGDCGICFEYAVHEAITSGDGRVMERMHDATKLCKLPCSSMTSILFGLEKSGSQQLIDTANEILTDDSSLLYGTAGRPAKLRRHLSDIAANFRRRKTELPLPQSIRGLWKTDLFIGNTDTDRWLATTVKINPTQLQGAAGLRIGIVPTKQGKSDKVRRDESKNLVICPLHHDQDFMQIFFEGWRIVQAFIAADATIPSEAALPLAEEREVARILAQRREFPVLEVVEAIAAFGQRGLLETDDRQVELQTIKGQANTDLLIAPVSRSLD